MEQRFKGSAELEEMYNGNTYSESEYSDKSIDEGEDELISLRKSSNEQVITRCGMRPEKLKDKEKGKQRKHFKYPSSGRNEGSNCPFRCYGKLMLTESSFYVISLIEEHNCVRNFKYGNLVNYKWIGKHFGHKIRQNPEIKLHEIADMVLKKFKCIVSPAQCRNAKTFALTHGERTNEEHYAMIRSYGKEILDSNNGSTVKLELLGEDIDMLTGNGLTLISDQHKGLIEAVKDVMPLAEHKQCAKHIYEDFRK
ncbi:hypothetical protein Tco_0949506 [Tanacetum coccineum]